MKYFYAFAALLLCSPSTAQESGPTPAVDSIANSALVGVWSGKADFRGTQANVCMMIAPGPGSKHLVLEYKFEALETQKILFSGLGTYVLTPENKIEGSWLDSMNNHFKLAGVYASTQEATSMSVIWSDKGRAIGKSDYIAKTEANTLEVTDAALAKDGSYKPFFTARLSRTKSASCTP